MTRHRKLLPEPLGDEMQLRGIVCAAFKADIVDEIDSGEDCHAVMKHHI